MLVLPRWLCNIQGDSRYLYAILQGENSGNCSDSSYSGLWAKQCAEFLEEQGVKACVHSAKEKQILLSVRASCRSYEIPRQRYFTLHGCGNDKNTGTLWNRANRYELAKGQHIKQADTLLIKCGNDSTDLHCKLGEDAS